MSKDGEKGGYSLVVEREELQSNVLAERVGMTKLFYLDPIWIVW